MYVAFIRSIESDAQGSASVTISRGLLATDVHGRPPRKVEVLEAQE